MKLDHGSYYVLRGCEWEPLVAWFKDGNWFLIPDDDNPFSHVLMIQDDKLGRVCKL